MPETVTRQALARQIIEVAKITGTFRLRSGATSDVYFDKYRFESHPTLLAAIARHLAELVPDETERLIGLEMGGIPLATALALELGKRVGFCRKKPKEYGTCQQIEGGVEAGERVVIVEDVITSGGAAVEAVEALREAGCETVRLVCVVDREAGAADRFKALALDYRPLFTWSQLDELTQ